MLVAWLGWRAIFFLNLVIGLPGLARARSLLRESRAAHAAFPDVIRGSGGSYDGIPGFGVSREAR